MKRTFLAALAIAFACVFSVNAATDSRRDGPPFPRGHIAGLALTPNATTTKFDTAVGTARDSTDVQNLSLPAAITAKQLNVAWATGSSAGCLDTGAIGGANTWYHVYLIQGRTVATDILCSLSPIAGGTGTPTLPSNYAFSRRIGSIKWDGAAIYAWDQRGERFCWNHGNNMNTALSNPNTVTAISSAWWPPGVRVLGEFIGTFLNSSGNTDEIAFIGGDLTQSSGVNGSWGDLHALGAITSGFVASRFAQVTNLSQQIKYSTAGAAGSSGTLVAMCWTDWRGRFD